MLLDNQLFLFIVGTFLNFCCDHIIALIVLVILILYANSLSKYFSKLMKSYKSNTPPEKYFVKLQCQRWEKNANQVCTIIGLSIACAFIVFVFSQMIVEVFNITESPKQAGDTSIEPINILQLCLYIGLISFKIRAIMDIRSVLVDIKKAGL